MDPLKKYKNNFQPMVSIIIPVLRINNYLRESIPIIYNLQYGNYEVIVLPNVLSEEDKNLIQEWWPKVRVIETFKVTKPAEKRDLGAKCAKGEILAFLDDDAYPKKDWITNAIKHFTDQGVAAVGGPAVTPKNDPILGIASGMVYTSLVGGGNLTFRYWPTGSIKDVDDYPSVNLFVRKDIFNLVGGFDSKYWPGEDTKLCLEIKKRGKRIIYDPEVFVWHHRRSSLFSHLKQVWNYAMHRGLFTKKYPETSRRFVYFIPSIFVAMIIIGFFLSLFAPELKFVYLFSLLLYLFVIIIASVFEIKRYRNFFAGLLAIPLFFLTHIVYGIGFLQGLGRKDLKI